MVGSFRSGSSALLEKRATILLLSIGILHKNLNCQNCLPDRNHIVLVTFVRKSYYHFQYVLHVVKNIVHCQYHAIIHMDIIDKHKHTCVPGVLIL